MDSTGPKPRRHVFGFLDETGLLHSPQTDRVFALGLLVCPNPRELHKAIVRLKNKRRYHREFKFSDVSKQNLRVYLELVDVFFDCISNRFHVVVVDKQHLKIPKTTSTHTVYNRIAANLVADSIDRASKRQSEYMTILADDVSTSKDDKFERILRDEVKRKQRRNALFGIARLESHAVSEIQIVDVLLGTVAYAYKIKMGIIRGSGAKLRLLKHLQRKLGIQIIAQEQTIKVKRGEMFEVIEHK